MGEFFKNKLSGGFNDRDYICYNNLNVWDLIPSVNSILTVRLTTTLFLCEEDTACVCGRVTWHSIILR